ncbi:hypothetical protein JTB14_003869 [Gonioctena quinquepunctata]|nr:hypothetical protein JTB14_003869 [Gonioctena quinquepunctata]
MIIVNQLFVTEASPPDSPQDKRSNEIIKLTDIEDRDPTEMIDSDDSQADPNFTSGSSPSDSDAVISPGNTNNKNAVLLKIALKRNRIPEKKNLINIIERKTKQYGSEIVANIMNL